ncbi:hypothetical protein [Burkholderia multivorans]|uniref:hypothetical protein n=1 Tax=Burkholderia multivorans TaxID=87883 RepID=UPI001C61158D|nr:hypothetical protein [Burkholderia multivorans]
MDEIGMEGFLIRVATRDASTRVDEARPDNPPNEDDAAEGWRRGSVAEVCGREAATGAGGPELVAG